MFIVFEFLIFILRFMFAYIKSIFGFFIPKNLKDISGQIVVITGGGHGIGRELAYEMSAKGATVVTLDVNEKGNTETADLIKQNGRRAHAYVCDVTIPKDVRAVAQKIKLEVGEVTILINNAGVLNGAPLLELRNEDIRRTFEVNTLAHFWTLKEFLPGMVERNDGHIVTISSISAKFATPLLVDYSASKYAVFGLNEGLTEELDRLGSTGIHTTVVLPNVVNTGMTKYPNQRFGSILTPREVALVTVDGILRQEPIIYVPRNLRVVTWLKPFIPFEALKLSKKFGKFGIEQQYWKNTRDDRR